MKRRSFFGVVFGGFLARWLPLPKQIRFRGATIPVQQFKPPSPPVYHYFPMEGGAYKAGETFSIGRRRIVSLDRPTGYAEVEVRELLPGGVPRPS